MLTTYQSQYEANCYSITLNLQNLNDEVYLLVEEICNIPVELNKLKLRLLMALLRHCPGVTALMTC